MSESLASLLNPQAYLPAVLALADGEVFYGYGIGAKGDVVAELVFNTSMTGYQEILTDASYHDQMVLLTYPHIGNTGVNDEDVESAEIAASALVIRNVPTRPSSFRSTQSLPEYLSRHGVVAIAGVDTRKITRILREKGAMGACIQVCEAGQRPEDIADEALAKAQAYQGMAGQDLAQVVTRRQEGEWAQKTWTLEAGYTENTGSTLFHVVAYDFGVKYNILRLLADRGCRITVVPAQTPVEQILKLQPDGIFLSNGPGDPEPCDYAIETAKVALERKIPLFGICLGHQIMGLAVGAKTLKMKTGHHGANHPVKDLRTGHVYITSQNHGFAVDADTLPANAETTHVSLFDGSLQGFRLTDRPAFCFQGHPEASPGPHDIVVLFDQFIQLMKDNHA